MLTGHRPAAMAVEVWGITVFTVGSYVSGYIAALLVATCFATSLFYLSDVAEDNPSATRVLVRTAAYSVAAVQALLYLLDDFPFRPVAIGVCAHAVYASLCGPAFPDVAGGSRTLWAAVVLFVADNAGWYYFVVDNWAYTTVEVFGYCITCCWLVPLALFVSLHIGGSGLPTHSGSAHDHGTGAAAGAGADHARR